MTLSTGHVGQSEEREGQRVLSSYLSSIFIFFFTSSAPKPQPLLSDSNASLFETRFIRAFFLTPAEKVQRGDARGWGVLLALLRAQCAARVYLVPARCKAASVGGAECGEGNKEGNDPWHGVEDSVSEGLGRHKEHGESPQWRRGEGELHKPTETLATKT